MTDAESLTALAALPDVVAYDKSLASDPSRMRAALLDVASEDEPGIEHVALSVRLAIPDLVTARDLTGAQLRLVNIGGLRLDVARSLLLAWESALSATGRSLNAEPDGELYLPVPGVAPGEAQHAVGPADCHVWPDGAVTVIVLGLDRLSLATLSPPVRSGSASWHPIAAPSAPVSRAAVLAALTDSRAAVFWTDNSGLWSRPLRRDGGPVELAEARILDAPATGQARYPISALAVDGRDVDIFWTADRRELMVSTRNALGEIARRAVPSPCEPRERLSALDCAVASTTTAWLAALTDRGRLLVARWDIPAGDHDGWRVVHTPGDNITAITVVMLSAGASLLVGDAKGAISTTDAGSAYAGTGRWRPVHVPPPSANLEGLVSLSASSHGDVAWAVATTAHAVHLIRLQRHEEVADAVEAAVLK